MSVEEIVKPAGNGINSQDKSAVNYGKSVDDINHNEPLCETPTVVSRSAGLQEVAEASTTPTVGSRSAGLQEMAEDGITSDTAVLNNCLMSDQNSFHTPRKSTDGTVIVAIRHDSPPSSHLSKGDECNFSDESISSRFDRRKCFVTDEGCNQPRRSPRISQKLCGTKKKIIKRVARLPTKHKYISKRRQYDSVQSNDSFTNSVNYDATRHMSSLSSPDSTSHITEYTNSYTITNIDISNRIDCTNGSSFDNNIQEVETNSNIVNKNNLSTSYSSRRRYVRNLKQYIFSLGSLDVQAAILSDLLNDSEMKPLVDAAGVTSPAESNFNNEVVNHVFKQIDRSSSKVSTRGRVNDDKQSYKINMAAALMKSPNSNVDLSVRDKTFVNMLFSKTCLTRSSARRLVMKAKQRRRILTNAEKETTWSIISHRQSTVLNKTQSI